MRWLGLILLAACKFSTNISGDGGVDGKEIDAAIDAPPDMMQANCFGSGMMYVCVDAPPSGTEDLNNNNTLDTDACNIVNSSKRMTVGGQQVCVIAATTIMLGAADDVVISGSLPLVLAATQAINIDGGLDAASYDAKRGPNANASQCNSAGIDGTAMVGGSGGGGAGGTFGTIGGNGGTGGATAGGVATTPPAKSAILRGGCAGGTGMPGGTAGNNAAGGAGGGAIMLASHGTITIKGEIDASGSGAIGGLQAKGGGGGGGSGGMIVFDALGAITINATARINANGGGGGGGAGQGANGDPGADPIVTMPLVAALGGQDETQGKIKGGNGAAGTTNATAGGLGSNGGGGGGGGHGLIRVTQGAINFPAGTVSPTPVN